ncbi:hypothetical protein M569_02819 [Genlisea aurea]|uniref:MI domain-containing protein n=1 Tax=Genlisea aurea TaxID=192259 RepID=S8EGZ6_9LAMI|nr:hypothetical protein M569_02819 [Genlisea aurea]
MDFSPSPMEDRPPKGGGENGEAEEALAEFRKKSAIIIEEYFDNDDLASTADELRDLEMHSYAYYFVKKLVSTAMDRRDKEKEMASALLSSLYGDLISPSQVYKGFHKLVESADDFTVDIPDAVDVLAMFIARAVVDDILPPSFLSKTASLLGRDSKGLDAIRRAEKSYLSAPLHAETMERRWGGGGGRRRRNSVDDLKRRIDDLLIEYTVSGDVKEACRCIKDLGVPHFHHEIVKRAVVMAMEKRRSEGVIMGLLKRATEEGLINSSQTSKGFSRIIDSVEDLRLDIPNAEQLLQGLISKAASDGWLSASSLKPLRPAAAAVVVDEGKIAGFKKKAVAMIREYFLSGDVSEVSCCLEMENEKYSSPELNAAFVKKLIDLAMDRKNREKEMASVLLSTLRLPSDDVAAAFVMLIESAGDASLDNPDLFQDLAMFLSRAVVDEVLAPKDLEEIGRHSGDGDPSGVIRTANSLLGAPLSSERILRCWGGWAAEDVKWKIGSLLAEFEAGGDAAEACRCIKELGMPFFHHEVVKKCVVRMMEGRKEERMWGLLDRCFQMRLISGSQMREGFGRVRECVHDLALDVPQAHTHFDRLLRRAHAQGWIIQETHIN